VTTDASRHRTLLEINNAIISSLTRDALFEAVARALKTIVPFDRTAIFLHDPTRDVLRLFVREASMPSEYFAVGFEMPVADSHVGWAFRHEKPLVRRDLGVEREFPAEDLALRDGVRSYVIVPLVAHGRAVGAFAVASTRANAYAAADVTFVQDVANQIGLAVANMLAFEEIEALRARLERENAYLQEEVGRGHYVDELVGQNPTLTAVLSAVGRVAPTDATVLITGETGTGKELVARAIHRASRRRDRPLVKVDCGGISAGLVESELFGHVKGAFTGALERRIGRFELADGGTIFLDEVGELPAESQVKLLRVLQERELEPVGSNRTVRVDVRVIAATNRVLDEAVKAGRFRADLFYRLNVFPIELPPLRERASDVPLLAALFVTRFARGLGKDIQGVAPAALERLVRYPWPGNVRELQNVVERAAVLCQGRRLDESDILLPEGRTPSPSAPPPTREEPGLDEVLATVERAHIEAAIRQARGVIEGPRGAARALKVHPNTLRSRMEKLGISRVPHEDS
jgi:formate hydrogenlyase transcriptional activator